MIALAILCGGSLAEAGPFQTETWIGTGAGTLTWTNKLDWTPQLVGTNGDALIFAVAPTNNPQNNFTNLNIYSITFTTNGYALGGSALTITNGITDNGSGGANPNGLGGGNSEAMALTLGASQTFQNNSSVIGTNATYFTNTESGAIELKGHTLTIGGTAPLFLTGAIGSSTSTNGGNLIINNSSVARLAVANVFGTNTVVITSGITNGLSYTTNYTYYTNLYVIAGVSTNYTYITNTAIATNGTWSYGTNVFGTQNAEVVAVQAGTLQLNNAAGIPSGANVGNLSLDGTLDLNGISPTINGLDDSGAFSGVVDNINTANTGLYVLTLGNGNSNGVFSGVIQNTAGSVGLTKIGYGTETLEAANQYNGPTLVNQGTLVVAGGASLGAFSTTLTIGSGAVLDVSGLGSQGYLPAGALTVAAGTPTKPYTNFLGSYDPYWPTYSVSITGTNTFITFATNTDLATFTNVVRTTNYVATTYSTNSIISIVNADVKGSFTVNGGGAISPITSVSPGLATWAISSNLTLDSSYLPSRNRVNFLLNNTTTTGGGTNDLIAVSGKLKIGDELDFLITPVTGTLAAGTYTLMTSSGYTAETGIHAPNFQVITSRGLFGDTVQASGNNITLTSLGGTAVPGNIFWAGTPILNNWDVHLSQNWLFNGTNDYFYPGDNVNFGDAVGTVTMPVVLEPGSVTFNNNKTNITFTQNQATFITGSAGGFVKNGSGTVTLQNPNALLGPVTVNGGILALGYYNSSTFGQNVLFNGVPAQDLILGGGEVLQNTGINIQPNEGFQDLVINPGASAMYQQGRGSSELPCYDISNNVTRVVGGVLDVQTTTKAGSHGGFYFEGTNSPDGTNDYGKNGIVGGWATYFLSDWLYANTANTTASGSSAYPAAFYQSQNTASLWGATSNVLVSASVSGIGTQTINSLKINTTGSYALNINSGSTLTLASGGILIPTSTGYFNDAISGGTLLGDPSDDLIILNNNIVAPSTLTIGSVIADNGGPCGLTTAGGGTTVLTGNNTYTGPTYIDNGFGGATPGTLQVGANGTSGSIATSSAVIDNGILAFNRSDNTSVSGAISGTGGLTKLSAGALTLTANNSLSGLVTITAGTLQLGNGGASGSVSNAVGIVDNATLAFGNNITVGYPNVISGYGGLVQFGTGNLIIPTNETYSGNTVVSNGTLTVTASGSISNTAAIVVRAGTLLDVSALGGGLTLRSAAPSEVLAGSGTVNGSVTTSVGTTLSPGTNGVIGTLTINNNLTLGGGNLVFDVGNGNGNGDRINVGGTLTENGGTVIINVTGGTLNNGVYPLIHAGGGVPSGSVTNLGIFGFVQSGQIAQLINDPSFNNLSLLVSPGTVTTLTWVGLDGSGNAWDIGGTANWTAGAGNTTYANPDYTTIDDTGSATPAINIASAVSPTSVTNNANTKNYTLGIPGGTGKITGGASLVKNGTSTLTLQALNDYLGGTAINAGVVQLGNNAAANADGMVGGSGSISISNNATLVVSNAATETMSGSLNGSGQLMQQGIGKLVLAGDNSAFAGTISVTNFLQMGNGISGNLGIGPVTDNRTLLLDVGPTPVSIVAVAANISGSGNVTNIGPGIVLLTGSNTWAGNTAIPEGKIQIGSGTALPTTTTVFMDCNNSPGLVGTLDLNGQNVTIGNLAGNTTGQGAANFIEPLIVNNGTGTATLTVNGGTATSFSGQLLDNNNGGTGQVALRLLNNTALTLNPLYNNAAVPVNLQPNLFSGGIIVSNSSLTLGTINGSGDLNGGKGAAAGGIGTITLEGGLGTITNGTIGFPTNGILYTTDSSSGSSTTPTFSTTLLATINVPAGQYGTMFLPSRGTWTCTLTGGGTLIVEPNYVRGELGGNWTNFTGTIIFEAIFQPAGAGTAFSMNQPLGYPNATLFMGVPGGGVSISGANGGNAFPIGALSGGDNTSFIGGGTQGNGSSGGAANTIWAIGGLNLTTTNGSQILDTGCGIRKVGTGTLTLTNTVLSFGGQCVVSNGTLAFAPLGTNVDGSLSNYTMNANYLVCSNFTIVDPGILDMSQVGDHTLRVGHNGTQTFFGDGTVKGNLVTTNNLIAPAWGVNSRGTFPGNLRVTGNAEIDFGSTIQMAVNSTVYDKLTVAGTLAINSARLTVITNGPAFAGGTSNVFYFFDNPAGVHHAVVANTIGSAGTVGITNITVPTLPAGMFWVTNLTLDGSMALVNTNASVVINPNPSPVQVTVNGNQLTLGWAANLGWILQSQTNSASVGLSTNWVDVAGSALITNVVITINPNSPSVFYRLRSPP